MKKGESYKQALTDTEKWLMLALKERPTSKFYKGYLASIEQKKEKFTPL